MDNNNINVETSTLTQAAADINSTLQELEGILAQIKSAGSEALTAVGGDGTKVGGALKAAMLDVDEAEFKKQANSLSTMATGVSKAGSEYDAEEAEIMKKIQSRTGQGGAGGGGVMTSSNAHNNVTMARL